MGSVTKIAIVCQYELIPSRIGGMDYFFVAFQEEVNKLNIEIDWYFPNMPSFDLYKDFTIITHPVPENKLVENCKQGEKEYDLIFTHFVELCTPTFKELKKYSQAKIIAVDHNPRPLNGYPLKKRIIKKIKGLWYSRYIDKFVGVSEYTKRELIKDFGNQINKKTIVIYNGIVTRDIIKRNDRSFQNPKFVVISHLRESKGIQDVIKAVALLKEELKCKIHIDVYGDGPYKDNLVNLCKELKVVNNFNFKGSTGEVKKILANYDYLLHPTYMECFSLTILESLGANVPVITTPVGGNEEVVKDGINGFILPAKDSEKWSEVIEKLCLGKLSIKGNTFQEIEKQYAIERMVQNYIKLI